MKQIAVALASALVAFTAFAQSAPAPDVLATLKAKYPNTQWRSVMSTPVAGVYEVIMGQNVAYTDNAGRYFFFGRLFDMQTQADLTEPRMQAVNTIDTKLLPAADALKVVKGNGKRTLYIFSDPDCPYCKQLEGNLRELTDVTIYYYFYPLTGMHPDARRKSIAAWCAKNPAEAWEAMLLNGVVPPAADCPNPIDRNVALAGRLGITATPTIIAADGRRLPGAATAARIDAWLNSAPAQVAEVRK
jgi:thiol:disulfide interchange protein DsbC